MKRSQNNNNSTKLSVSTTAPAINQSDMAEDLPISSRKEIVHGADSDVQFGLKKKTKPVVSSVNDVQNHPVNSTAIGTLSNKNDSSDCRLKSTPGDSSAGKQTESHRCPAEGSSNVTGMLYSKEAGEMETQTPTPNLLDLNFAGDRRSAS
jgi:hypothetical protein